MAFHIGQVAGASKIMNQKIMNQRTYKFGTSSITIIFGDITESKARAIVSSDDHMLSMSGGVSRAILKAAGNSIALEAAKKVPARLGDVVVTSAGSLPALYIFHAVTLSDSPEEQRLTAEAVIKQTTKRCMELVRILGIDSIAFPAIGAGVAGFNIDTVAAEMAEIIANDLIEKQGRLSIFIYLFNRFGETQPVDYISFFEQFSLRVPSLANRTVSIEPATPPFEAEAKDPRPVLQLMDEVAITDREYKSRRINNLRSLIASLEDQRFKLEARLIDLLAGTGQEQDIDTVRRKLKENQELRLEYLTELKSFSDGGDGAASKGNKDKTISVFVSSTYKDLVPCREAVKDQITRLDMRFRGMEHFGADPHMAPAAKIVEEVRAADVYLGIFGVRYGYIDQATGLSMTELEFNEAKGTGKPMLLYVIHEDAPVKVSDIESNPQGKEKLDSLKKRILSQHTVYQFSDREDLARQVYQDLGKLKQARNHSSRA